MTFEFENVSALFAGASPVGYEGKADVVRAIELAEKAKYAGQPWVNENDSSINFESTEMFLRDIVELVRQFEHKFEPALVAFFDYLVSGRSFSGRRISDNARFYAYLTAAEVADMSALLSAHHEECFNLMDKGAFCKVDFEEKMLEVMESLLTVLKQASEFDLFITVS